MKLRLTSPRVLSTVVILSSLTAMTTGCTTPRGALNQIRLWEESLESVGTHTSNDLAALNPGAFAARAAPAAISSPREELAIAEATASIALERAREAERRARGQLLHEQVYRIDELAFEAGSDSLTPGTRNVLDQVAERLQLEDLAFYLEIRGRGDGHEPPAEGRRLGELRAESVRRYLHGEKGLPLHRLSAIALSEPASRTIEPPPGQVVILVLR